MATFLGWGKNKKISWLFIKTIYTSWRYNNLYRYSKLWLCVEYLFLCWTIVEVIKSLNEFCTPCFCVFVTKKNKLINVLHAYIFLCSYWKNDDSWLNWKWTRSILNYWHAIFVLSWIEPNIIIFLISWELLTNVSLIVNITLSILIDLYGKLIW